MHIYSAAGAESSTDSKQLRLGTEVAAWGLPALVPSQTLTSSPDHSPTPRLPLKEMLRGLQGGRIHT